MIRILLHPFTAASFGLLLLLFWVLAGSDFAGLWVASFAAFYASLFALGWRKAPPVLVWIATINLLTIWADIAVLELSVIRVQVVEPYLPNAIFNASCAILFLAIGMGLICRRGEIRRKPALDDPVTQSITHCDETKLFLCYIAFMPAMVAVNLIASSVPALSQPAIAFGALKFVLIYLLAARTFSGNSSPTYLVAVIGIELVIGSTGYFASYKEAVFVVLIALAASERAISARSLILAATGVSIIVYMSVVWSAVKQDFRTTVASGDSIRSMSWLAEKYFNPEDIDLVDASIKLLDRVAYAKFYAMIFDRDTQAFSGIYMRALQTTITPRFLFPNKAVLDDSAQTSAILGINIQDGTSIGLGYVAQAHIDFGFPGLALPLIALGALIGAIYRYFATQSGPVFLGQAFACGTLFNTLSFAGNIDKQLGGLIMLFLVMALTYRFGGPYLLRFITARPDSSRLRKPPVL